MVARIAFPAHGEGAPVRTLGRMRSSYPPSPVGAIHESPADKGPCPTKRAVEGASPYGGVPRRRVSTGGDKPRPYGEDRRPGVSVILRSAATKNLTGSDLAPGVRSFAALRMTKIRPGPASEGRPGGWAMR